MPLPFEVLSPSLAPRVNAHGQLIGKPLADWSGCALLPDIALQGRMCRVEPFDADKHAESLFAAYNAGDPATCAALWTYLPYDLPRSVDELHRQIAAGVNDKGFHTFSIVDSNAGRAVGQASFMRYDPPNGSVEVGMVAFSPLLQRSIVATEAMYLMMKHAFGHGYRRYEWKCDQLNIPSNRAALRLGFQFEGTFRNAMVRTGRRRDTCWYSVIVEDWPAVRARLETWLNPGNFSADGRQRTALNALPL